MQPNYPQTPQQPQTAPNYQQPQAQAQPQAAPQQPKRYAQQVQVDEIDDKTYYNYLYYFDAYGKPCERDQAVRARILSFYRSDNKLDREITGDVDRRDINVARQEKQAVLDAREKRRKTGIYVLIGSAVVSLLLFGIFMPLSAVFFVLMALIDFIAIFPKNDYTVMKTKVALRFNLTNVEVKSHYKADYSDDDWDLPWYVYDMD